MKNIILLIAESFRIIAFEIFSILIPLIGLKILNLDNFSIGISLFLFSIGYLIFSYTAGRIVDAYNKKKLIIWIYITQSILLCVFYMYIDYNSLFIWIYYLLILMLGLSVVFIETAVTAWMPDIYATNRISNGAGILQTGKSISNLIAPTIGGALISLYGYNHTVVLLIMLLLLNIPLTILLKSEHKPNSQKNYIKPNKRFKRTFKYILTTPSLKAIMLTTATINLAFSIYGSLIVIYLSADFQLSEYIIGIIFSISGIGALIGSVLSPYLIKKFGSTNVMIFGPLIPSFGLLLLAIPNNQYTVLLFSLGIFFSLLSRSLGSVARLTVQSLIIPSEERAEVNGTLMMFTWGTIPIGTLIGSYLSVYLGIQKVMLIAGLILVISNIYMIKLRASKYKITQRNAI
ncbi:MFS transporter [Lysinibacillus sp. FSL K6-3209]|uniref:MFS transporter n=1 Tax=Lysinibacillus sp. FSL K6-3209 TaxID=2921497 RepID=UPI0030D8C4ED